jgi:phosphotransferase system enzyme I (PtsI)
LDKVSDTVTLYGISASAGLACGSAFIHYEQLIRVPAEKIQSGEVKSQLSRLSRAVLKSRKELETLRKEAQGSVGADLSKIFDAQLMILEDDDFMDRVRQAVIAKLQNVEFVYQEEVDKTIRALSRSKDEYMREMISDINAVSARLLHNLSGVEGIRQRKAKSPIIAFARSFSADDIMNMRKSSVVGFVTETGGMTSHMALFAKALGIPAIVGVKECLSRVKPNQQVCIDGSAGCVVISPTPSEWKLFRRKVDSLKRAEKKLFLAISGLKSETLDGRKVDVEANLEVPTENDRRIADAGISVGLYRTEFLYLSHSDFPDEQEQVEAYSKITKAFGHNHVTLRTFDLGGDKFTGHFRDNGESNPALGWRAIRFSLDVPKTLRIQLRAMLRASAHGKIKIMFPMISTVEEVVRAKKILAGVKKDLISEKIPFDEDIPIGVMVEVPSAVVMAHRLALEVDFFSIGTNDLTQYTLAADRGNAKVAKLYRPFHPAVITLIHQTIQAGHDANISVAVCGEMAGDPKATRLLVGLGVDSLSANPGSISIIKSLIPQIDYEKAAVFAKSALSMQSAEEVENLLADDFNTNYRGIPKRVKGGRNEQ